VERAGRGRSLPGAGGWLRRPALQIVYTPWIMRSVADELRAEQQQRVRALSVAERLELAFELGEFDLATLQAAHGLDRETAIRRLRAQKQRDRTPCSFLRDEDA